MADTVSMSAHESLEIVSSTPERLEVVATYLPHGTPPPRHRHPAQTESFDVTAGTLQVELDGAARTVATGESFEVPAGTLHRMWNGGDVPTTARWVTEPRLQTEEWFRGLDTLNKRSAARGMDGPDVLGFAAHAAGHRDVFRPVLVAGSAGLTQVLIAVLGGIGRLLGRQPGA